jgi:hypothetical protein
VNVDSTAARTRGSGGDGTLVPFPGLFDECGVCRKIALSRRLDFLRTTLRHGVIQGLDRGMTKRSAVGRTDGLGVKNT